jgi:hypothetical protein
LRDFRWAKLYLCRKPAASHINPIGKNSSLLRHRVYIGIRVPRRPARRHPLPTLCAPYIAHWVSASATGTPSAASSRASCGLRSAATAAHPPDAAGSDSDGRAQNAVRWNIQIHKLARMPKADSARPCRPEAASAPSSQVRAGPRDPKAQAPQGRHPAAASSSRRGRSTPRCRRGSKKKGRRWHQHSLARFRNVGSPLPGQCRPSEVLACRQPALQGALMAGGRERRSAPPLLKGRSKTPRRVVGAGRSKER